jgi:peptidoglycan/LPS O-acetylase OafA/YrhL
MAILICVTPYVLKVLEGFTDNRLALWFGGWLITVACVQGISLCFYHWLEIPSMSLGRRVTDAIAAIGTPKL